MKMDEKTAKEWVASFQSRIGEAGRARVRCSYYGREQHDIVVDGFSGNRTEYCLRIDAHDVERDETDTILVLDWERPPLLLVRGNALLISTIDGREMCRFEFLEDSAR